MDRAVAALAERQHGVVARAQLLEAGLSARAVERRVERGWLHSIHRGVYAVGHRRLTREGRWMAAVLACGPRAVLSHRSAAALWGILVSNRAAIEVTAPVRRVHEGLEVRRARLPGDEVTTLAGIPVTTVPRTLLDVAAVLPIHRLEKAVDEAERQRRTDHLSLAEVLDRHGPKHGSAKLRGITATETVTRSELEDRFLTFLDRHDLPRPEMNANVEGYEVDALWRDHGLIVELDGYAFHATRRAFEVDRARDRALQVAGWIVIRLTWRQLTPETAADLHALLPTPRKPRAPAHRRTAAR